MRALPWGGERARLQRVVGAEATGEDALADMSLNSPLTDSGSAGSPRPWSAGASVAPGRRDERRTESMAGWTGLPRPPGRAFHDRPRAVLVGAGFDRLAEKECAPYYASGRGRPSLPPRCAGRSCPGRVVGTGVGGTAEGPGRGARGGSPGGRGWTSRTAG